MAIDNHAIRGVLCFGGRGGGTGNDGTLDVAPGSPIDGVGAFDGVGVTGDSDPVDRGMLDCRFTVVRTRGTAFAATGGGAGTVTGIGA